MKPLHTLGMIAWLGLGFTLTGCGGNKPPLSPAEPPVVTIEKPVERELDDIAEFTGRLAAMETQEIRSQVSGYLKAIKFEEGGIVKQGDALYEIDPEPFDAAVANAKAMVAKSLSDIQSFEKQLALAKADYDRARQAVGALSQEEVDKRKTNFDTAESSVTSSKASLDSARANEKKALFDRSNCTIRSDVKGTARVSRTELTKGNFIVAGQTLLCKVTSLDPIHVYFDVDEDISLQFRRRIFFDKSIPNPRTSKSDIWVGMRDEKRGPNGMWSHRGTIDYIAPEIIRGLGTREIRAQLDNPGPDHWLSPGDSVRVQIQSGAKEKLITIPEIAIGSQQQQKFVYVIVEKDGKSIAEFRPVQLGAIREVDGVRMQIVRKGITTQDRVVVNGLLRVRPGIEVKATEQTIPVGLPKTPAK